MAQTRWVPAWGLLPGLVMGLAAGVALARGATGEEEALAYTLARRAPLALSANGEWRVHVDRDRVLHRAPLAGSATAQRITLPLPAFALSASRSGQRVAFTTESECVGLVDFGRDGRAPTIRWWPSAPAVAQRAPEAARALAADMPPEQQCGAGYKLTDLPVALSPDGRWLATPWQVIDTETGRVALQLPETTKDSLASRRPVRLQFVDGGRKLLVVSATLGEGYESPSSASFLQFAVWDLATRALHHLVKMDDAEMVSSESFFVDYSTSTQAIYWIDSAAFMKSRAEAAKGQRRPPLVLMERSLSACRAPARALHTLDAWQWASLVVDPLGRWSAGVRPLPAEQGAGRGPSGFTEELVVRELATGRVLQTRLLKGSVRGLLSLADGSALLGLVGPALPAPGGVAPPFQHGGELMRLDIDPLALKAAPVQAQPWGAACPLDDEAPDARQVAMDGRPMRLAWQQPVRTLGEQRTQVSTAQIDTTVPEGVQAAAGACEGLLGTAFVTADGGVWRDGYATITRLDPRSGRELRSAPTPRSPRVCSVPVPRSGGFVSYQGDTLSWRPFETAAGVPARRTLDLRPGWMATMLTVNAEAGYMIVYWSAKPGTRLDTTSDGEPLDTRVVVYGLANFQRLAVTATVSNSESRVFIGGEGAAIPPAPCRDAAGALRQDMDFRLGPFDSFRAHACGPGAPRTVFLSHLALREPGEPGGTEPRKVWATSGTTGLVQDGRLLRVFDLSERRELGRVALEDGTEVVGAHLIVADGLVLVETVARDPKGKAVGQSLRMYDWR